jgi:hypothetical protein
MQTQVKIFNFQIDTIFKILLDNINELFRVKSTKISTLNGFDFRLQNFSLGLA